MRLIAISFLFFLVLVFPVHSQMLDSEHYLASVIEGEAGVCNFEAKLAVAHVYSRNPTMFGYIPDYSYESLLIAQNWQKFSDPTNGAFYIVSREDLMADYIKEMYDQSSNKKHYQCIGQYKLYSF